MIYIDSDFKSHVNNSVGYTAVETDFFSGKCAEYIGGYRFIPAGETWTRADGGVNAPGGATGGGTGGGRNSAGQSATANTGGGGGGGGCNSAGGGGGSGIVIIRNAR
jgi:hypothetical protein